MNRPIFSLRNILLKNKSDDPTIFSVKVQRHKPIIFGGFITIDCCVTKPDIGIYYKVHENNQETWVHYNKFRQDLICFCQAQPSPSASSTECKYITIPRPATWVKSKQLATNLVFCMPIYFLAN
jgi:hypothetical protein